MKKNENIEKFATIVIDPIAVQDIDQLGTNQLEDLIGIETKRLIDDMKIGIQSTLKISNKVYRRRRNQE